jgi:endonuclease/exonuclease/phosphatase family metal-dependent hydrolase
MQLLVRTWNLFHGRTVPETGATDLERMVRLVCEDGPDAVCLQEVPVWALGELERWSGLQAFGAVAMRAPGGRLAPRLTDIHPRGIRSALTGQANALLVGRRLAVSSHAVLALNPLACRRRVGRRERLPLAARLAWARNRRVAQLVRVAGRDRSLVLVNTHLTACRDARPADAELLRLATYAEGYARPEEPIVLAGDLNLTRTSSRALAELERWGFVGASGRIDQIVVRGVELVRAPEAWPPARRRLGARLLSDHAPVEAEMMVP